MLKPIVYFISLIHSSGLILITPTGAEALVPTPVNISLTPSSVSLTAGTSQQFTIPKGAVSNSAVTWTVNPAVGTISTSGLYTAPGNIATVQTVTVQVTSIANSNNYANAKVTLVPVSVSLTPASANLAAAQTRQFTAVVGGTPNSGVTWTLSPAAGTVSSAGLYTSPANIAATQTVTMTATSSADPTKSASASLLLLSPLGIITETIPAAAGGVPFSATLAATGSAPPYTWTLLSGTLPPGLSLAASTGIIAGTPTAAGSYPFTVSAGDSFGNAVTRSLFIGVAAASYYVSGQNGNDSWSGLLASPNAADSDGPFRTVGKAQAAMQSSSTVKTTLVRAGTYPVASVWFLNPVDNGERWISYPGETAIFDGGTIGGVNLNNGGAGGVSHVAFEGLTFQNMGPTGLYLGGADSITLRWNNFYNCNQDCISGGHLTNSIIDSNTFNGQSPGNVSGPGSNAYSVIQLWYGSSNNRITHNLIQNSQGGGINFNAGPTDQPNNNNIVDRNILENVDSSVMDMGALYMYDASHSATGNQITNNIVNGNGGTGYLTNWTKALYLDDLMSNVLVSGNIFTSCGEYAWQIHGGDHNTIVNNIFDLSSTGTLFGEYQNSWLADFGMTGNVIERNLIYFSGTPPVSLYQAGILSSDVLPTLSNNLYYSATGAAIPNGQTIVDASPLYANPEFAQPSAANYFMPASSPAYTVIGFQPLPTDQGPLPNGTAGSMTGAGNSATTTANLTSEGPTDWVHWGDTTVNRKSGVTAQISDYTTVNSGAVLFYNNDPRTISWTDGTPTAAGSGADGVYIYSQQHGFSFTTPADSATRTLTIHAGGWSSGGTLTAHLSDNSAPDFVDSTSAAAGQYDRNYTLVYSAASAGQTLTVSWVQTSGYGNVTLNGAALR